MGKIVITGASGFIGTNLLEHFVKKGKEVLNVDKKCPQDDRRRDKWVKLDIRDYEKLKECIESYNPDYIIHLAARTDLDGKTLEDYTSNTRGTFNVLEAAKRVKSLKRVIFASSMLVCRTGYSPKSVHDYAPSNAYGESKVRMEQIIREEEPEYQWTIVRPTSIWGPGFGVPYRNYFEIIIRRNYLHIGNEACTKTYGYIGNTVYQLEKVLYAKRNKVDREVLYLGDYEPTNIEDWSNEIAEELGYRLGRIPFPIVKMTAIVGDALKRLGITFPMTTFRLKNMTTDNVVDLKKIRDIAPDLPYERKRGNKETIRWLKEKM